MPKGWVILISAIIPLLIQIIAIFSEEHFWHIPVFIFYILPFKAIILAFYKRYRPIAIGLFICFGIDLIFVIYMLSLDIH